MGINDSANKISDGSATPNVSFIRSYSDVFSDSLAGMIGSFFGSGPHFSEVYTY